MQIINEEKKPVTQLHSEVTEWAGNVQFVRSEIAIFQKQLSEIAMKNTHQEVLVGVEHFQNQFIRQLEVSDELRRALRKADHRLAAASMGNTDVTTIFVPDDEMLRDRAVTHIK